MITHPIPSRGQRRVSAPTIRSRCILNWESRRRTLHAVSGQFGTLTRAATATATDSNGTTYNVGYGRPRWDWRDTAGTGGGSGSGTIWADIWEDIWGDIWADVGGSSTDGVRDACGLLCGASDKVRLSAADGGAILLPPKAMAGYLDFIELGGVGVANAALLYLGKADNTGARFFLDSNGTYYRITHVRADGTTVSELLAAAPSNGDYVRLRWQLYANGSVQVWQSINGAEETASAQSSANAFDASTWGGGAAYWYLNSRGTGTAGQGWYRVARVIAGTPTLSTMRATV